MTDLCDVLQHLFGHLLHHPKLLVHLLGVESGDAGLVESVPRLDLGVRLRAEVVRDEVVRKLSASALCGAGELLVALLGEGQREADVALEGRRALALDVPHHRVQLAGHERVRVQE